MNIDHLNDRQREAVTAPPESCLVLAGAGSGKTSVLTSRIAWLVREEGIDPDSLMAVTFTNKAAEEMRKRLRKMIGPSVDAMWVGTFHSLCNKMLRECWKEAGLPKNFAIIDTDDMESIVRGIIKEGGMNFGVAKEGGMSPRKISGWIARQKEEGGRPGQCTFTEAESVYADSLNDVFAAYASYCHERGLLDFNDLMDRAVRLLRESADVRDTYRMRFAAILVDEFQDTNDLQYEWLQLVKGRQAFVMAVGDDDQSIYAFRGANPWNMNRFLDEMAGGRIIRLEQNYRSLPYILNAANAVIENNSGRLGKSLWSAQPDASESITVSECEDDADEAGYVANRIEALIRRGSRPSECAVIYRTNRQSRAIEQALLKKNVPFTVYGGFRFYDRTEVKGVLAWLDLIGNASHDVAFMKAIRTPPRGIGEKSVEEIRQAARDAGCSMLESAAERISTTDTKAGKRQIEMERFVTLCITLMEEAEKLPLGQFMARLVEASGIAAFYARDKDAESRVENLDELVLAATQFGEARPGTTAMDVITDYLAFVRLMSSTSEKDMEQKNTVSIMTVHAAKGLEFDNVFIVGAEENLFPSAQSVSEVDDIDEDADEPFVNGNLEEERRLMYVALTRARKHLEVTHARRRCRFGTWENAEPSRFIEEIPKPLKAHQALPRPHQKFVARRPRP